MVLARNALEGEAKDQKRTADLRIEYRARDVVHPDEV